MVLVAAAQLGGDLRRRPAVIDIQPADAVVVEVTAACRGARSPLDPRVDQPLVDRAMRDTQRGRDLRDSETVIHVEAAQLGVIGALFGHRRRSQPRNVGRNNAAAPPRRRALLTPSSGL